MWRPMQCFAHELRSAMMLGNFTVVACNTYSRLNNTKLGPYITVKSDRFVQIDRPASTFFMNHNEECIIQAIIDNDGRISFST